MNRYRLKRYAECLNPLTDQLLELHLLLGGDEGIIYADEPFFFQGDKAVEDTLYHLLVKT